MNSVIGRNTFRITKTDNLIFSLFACWCLVDALNGFLLKNDFFSISQIFKFFLAAVLIVRCNGIKVVTSLLVWIITYLSLYIVCIALHGEDIVSSIVLVSKPLTSILFFVYFTQIVGTDERYFEEKAFFVFKWNFIFFAINMVLGIMGYGYAAYGDEDAGFGSKGFFYAGNELSGVVASVFPWVFYYLRNNFSIVIYFISGALLLFLVYTLSTKSGIFATLLLFILVALFYSKKSVKMLMLAMTVGAVIYLIIHIQVLLSAELDVIQRFNFFMDRDGVLEALTSGRLQYWEEESKDYINSDFFTWIFGIGGMRTVEMDPPDSLLNCGFVGLIVLIAIYVKGVSLPMNRKNKHSNYSKVVLSSNLVLIGISILGGHIFFSSMAGMFISLSNAMLYVQNYSSKPKFMNIK